MKEKKNLLQKKQEFTVKLLQENLLEHEIQERLKIKFGSWISEQEFNKIKSIVKHLSKDSPTEYFKQGKKTGHFR